MSPSDVVVTESMAAVVAVVVAVVVLLLGGLLIRKTFEAADEDDDVDVDVGAVVDCVVRIRMSLLAIFRGCFRSLLLFSFIPNDSKSGSVISDIGFSVVGFLRRTVIDNLLFVSSLSTDAAADADADAGAVSSFSLPAFFVKMAMISTSLLLRSLPTTLVTSDKMWMSFMVNSMPDLAAIREIIWVSRCDNTGPIFLAMEDTSSTPPGGTSLDKDSTMSAMFLILDGVMVASASLTN